MLTYIFWNEKKVASLFLSDKIEDLVCWPFFPWCKSFYFTDVLYIEGMLAIYLALAIITTLCFFIGKVRIGYWFLLFLTFFKLMMVAKSYSFMGNYHYMPLWASIAYLFISDKLKVLKFLIASFYIGAGLIKFNVDWLSGASLLRATFFSGKFLALSLIYVLVLELVFAVGLVINRHVMFWFCFIQFIAFHIYSWHIVGFFYPSTMFCILSIFVLQFFDVQFEPRSPLFSFPKSRGAIAILSLFWLGQLAPKLWPVNPALTGLIRIPSLNMLDARTICYGDIFEKVNDQISLDRNVRMDRRSVRSQCDPIVFLSKVESYCKNNSSKQVDFVLMSRLYTDKEFQQVLLVKNICNKKYPLGLAEIFGVVQ